jgi:hypothetical protein
VDAIRERPDRAAKTLEFTMTGARPIGLADE